MGFNLDDYEQVLTGRLDSQLPREPHLPMKS